MHLEESRSGDSHGAPISTSVVVVKLLLSHCLNHPCLHLHNCTPDVPSMEGDVCACFFPSRDAITPTPWKNVSGAEKAKGKHSGLNLYSKQWGQMEKSSKSEMLWLLYMPCMATYFLHMEVGVVSVIKDLVCFIGFV
ncbi:uncharacterized protein LOC123402966 isoform X1 [Hordeum vulgare subsp. vulgare]|uniref:uncharacterized protein LOC123402966 isoform X1 n=1 Tax=Hordeum vulgare subsp. vulgare TaxID=112509 RepID=UPI001D1A5B46|nr:uncharacterized protein LOC123402966 isoform X1 [Hordeum vulgare subsp. vulgare]